MNFQRNGFSSLISESTTIDGNIMFDKILEVRGTIKGKIIQKENEKCSIHISHTALIETEELKAFNIKINGKIYCQTIWAENSLTIESDAKINGGKIYYRNLTIHDGAILNDCSFYHLDHTSAGEIT